MFRRLFFFILLLLPNSDLVAQKEVRYTNPVLAGFYPDPSICRAGNDYYIVNSSFAYFPGLPIFHSTDLVNWKQIGHAMDRPSQLDHDGAGVSRGLFAPAITYHNGKFYIVCTQIDKGGNFVITATNPAGPWSDPVWIPQVNGIDPSLFIESNGDAYLLYNSIPPNDIPEYSGHRTIRLYKFDINTLQVTGEERILVNGGVDISKKPVWIEAPHVFKKNDWYYLICAEGGTGYNHSEVVFRSRNMLEPFLPFEKNPILTQRHLDPVRKNPVTTTGHADFVETPDGKWYAVFLGCRPYENEHYNIGRETFMAPVRWENDWPIILTEDEQVSYSYPVPIPSITRQETNEFSGNFSFHDDFSSEALNPRWMFLRTVKSQWYSLTAQKGKLCMNVRPETCSGNRNPSFIAHRQQHHQGSVSTSVEFNPTNENEKAGIVVFQNETHFYYLCKSVNKGKAQVQLFEATQDSMKLLASRQYTGGRGVYLKIEMDRDRYNFLFSGNGVKWTTLKNGIDGKSLSTATAGGFVGSVFALYATSQGRQSKSKAWFDDFRYVGSDDVYKQMDP